MARDHDIPLDMLTNNDYGFVDDEYLLHSAKRDFYPMYLISETNDKIRHQNIFKKYDE